MFSTDDCDNRRRAWVRAVLALVAVFLVHVGPAAIAAPDRDQSNAYYDDARAYLDKGDVEAAVIQLKNALQSDPDNVAARYLLGEIYVRLGNGPAAEKELRKARARGLDEPRVVVALGRAYLLEGKYQAVLDEIKPGSRGDEIEANILLIRAQALMGLRRLDEAEAAVRQAASLQPDAAAVHLALARVLVLKGDAKTAEEEADKAIARSDTLVDAWILKGELRRLKRDFETALEAFGRALDLAPDNVAAHLGRAAALIDLGRDEDARADIEKVREIAEDHPLASYLAALIAARKKDYATAQDELLKVLRRVDNHLPSIFLYGAVSYAQNNLEQAEKYLSRFVEAAPGNAPARKLLGATLIRKRQPDRAIEALLPVIERAPKDAQTLALLGSAYMQKRDFAKSTEYFQKAVEAAPSATSAVRTQLALSQMAIGESELALSELKTAFELNPDETQAGILLALAQIRKRDFEGALASAKELEARLADNPLPFNLEGAAYLGLGKTDEARKSFEKAIAIRSDYFPARMNLAQLDLRAGDAEAARAQYQAILEKEKNHVGALMALAELAAREKRTDEAIGLLERARETNPKAIQPRLRLVNVYIAQRAGDKALAVARELETIAGDNPDALYALARAQMAAGEVDSAIVTYRRLAGLRPESGPVLVGLASAQIQAKDFTAARKTLAKAQEVAPDYLPGRAAAIQLELLDEKYDAALALARKLGADHPKSAVGPMLEGDALMRKGAFDEAAKAYRAAYGRQASAAVALRLYNARRRAGDIEAALAALRDWVEANPEDHRARAALAGAYLNAARYRDAIAEYERLLAVSPENPVLLNNLAWAYHKVGDARARDYAQRAHDKAPQSSEITDTLGWILVNEGENERGLALLKEAAAEAPDQSEIRYHLAVALNAAGRRDEARRELEAVVRSGRPFAAMDEARKLLRALSSGG